MKKMKLAFAALLAAAGIGSAQAGGMLTNTNQNVAFLRLPARDASIDIDGVYLNPAGVAFMSDGFHLGLNWQAAWQTREINSTNQLLYPMNLNDKSVTKNFKGDATAPVIPSIQAAYNKNRWSFQFNFAVHGGGGKCTFDNGIGTFDEALGKIAMGLKDFGATGYRANSYMQGKQYYFGFTLGAAYKVTDHLSVYGGVRALYGTASYKATINNIKVGTAQGDIPFDKFLAGAQNTVSDGIAQCEAGIPQLQAGIGQLQGAIAQLQAAGMDASAYQQQLAQVQAQLATVEGTLAKLQGAQPTLQGLSKYSEGVDLMADQEGFGVAPIIGIDYKTGNFNFAAKYEFRTHMSLKNESSLMEAGILEPLKKFEDGRSIREDNPAMLALGAQWSVLPSVRINAGYHHFYDKDAVKYENTQDILDGGTNEYLFGAGWDITNKLTVSAGGQITKYGLTDDFMNDMSFVVNSWSWGAGIEYKLKENLKLQLAYFCTNYDDYKTQKPNANGSINEYTRTNKVLGVGVTMDF